MCRIMSVLQFFSTVSYRAVSYKKILTNQSDLHICSRGIIINIIT